jgi:hypothetical protein
MGWAELTNKTEEEVKKYFFLGVEEGKKINKIENEKYQKNLDVWSEDRKRREELEKIRKK